MSLNSEIRDALLPDPDRKAKVRQTPKGETVSFRCPKHDDERPSAYMRGGSWHCEKCGISESIKTLAPLVGVELRGTRNGRGGAAQGRGDVIAEYDYVDETGRLLYQALRYDPKDFGIRRPNGNGGWINNKGDVRLVPYHLPDVLSAANEGRTVYICEGEKDCDRLAELGLTATTNVFGAGKWLNAYSEPFRGAIVCIVPDNDKPGREHGRAVARSIHEVAAEVRILELPGLPEKGDVSDWLDAGHTVDELDELAFDASLFDPFLPDVEPLVDPVTIRFARFLEADPPPRRSLVVDVLPIPIAALLAAIGGTGKSYLLYQLAISIATGLPFLGLRIGEVGSVLCLFGEDDNDELHRRALQLLEHYRELGVVDTHALGERLHVASRVACDNLLTRAGTDGEAIRTPIVDRLIATAARIPDLKLIAIDPTSRFRGGNANSEEHVTRYVEATEAIRDATGATVINAAHATKLSALTGDSEQGMVRGSSALVDGFRWVATLVKMTAQQAETFGVEPGDRRRYLRLEIPKSNYTAPFGGLWLERQGGGILVPAELAEVPPTQRQQARENDLYEDVVARLAELFDESGPQTKEQIREAAGKAGRLGAGRQAVLSILQRALGEGRLVEFTAEITRSNGRSYKVAKFGNPGPENTSTDAAE